MSIAEMLPEVRSLSRQDKIKLTQVLARQLERDEAEIIEPRLSDVVAGLGI